MNECVQYEMKSLIRLTMDRITFSEYSKDLGWTYLNISATLVTLFHQQPPMIHSNLYYKYSDYG